MKIYGVDFSGARGDSNTWLAEGDLVEGELTLESCRPIRRASLAELLRDAPMPCIAAMDFPFGVPQAFATYWAPGAKSVVDLWRTAVGTEIERFLERRDAFVEQQGEQKRTCDEYYPESYSSLHKANPNMLPMTYHGMRLMNDLHDAGWSVSPVHSDDSEGRIAIEVMPGATLNAMVPNYRGYKKGRDRFEKRKRILECVSKSTLVALVEHVEIFETCMANDDALDAVVAALTGALWVAAPDAFRLPSHEELPGASIEGWMCVPALLGGAE